MLLELLRLAAILLCAGGMLASFVGLVGTVGAAPDPCRHGRCTPTPAPTPTPTATLVSPTATATPTPGTATLLFEDTFDGVSLDRSKWRSDGRWGIAGNCQSDSNITVSGGALHLRMANDPALCGTAYSGAVIQTSYAGGPGFKLTYGYAEAVVRVPYGPGLWPAFWLYSWTSGCPELDVAEWLGGEVHSTFHGTVHYADCSQDSAAIAGTDWADGAWHSVGLDWRPGRLDWYADGVLRRTVIDARVPSGPQYILLNVATGGWGGTPDASTVLPAYLDVDMVRVWDRRP